MQTILVVDPDQHFREYVKLVLQRAGYAVHALSNGGASSRLLRDLAVDAVICDVYLPDADAAETMLAFRAVAPQLPVIVMTGSGLGPDDARWQTLTALGVRQVIAKPARPQEILAALRLALPASPEPPDAG